jgi:5-methyltetrahydropteroyltriglutamate--homocysteine methyltransferase
LIFQLASDSLAQMKIIPATHSSLPRVGDKPEEQKLRRAHAKLDKGKITKEELRRIEDSLISELVGIQEDAGCEIITDGMIRWYDHASHIAGHLKGFEINGLLRFMDTNYYYRQPVVSDEISAGNGGLADEFRLLHEKTSRMGKAILLGPYSLAAMSQNNSSMNFENLALRIADILAEEIHKLSNAGAEFIQIEEPVFVREPKDPDLFRDCLAKIAEKKGGSRLILAFYFGDSSRILDDIVDLPVDLFSFDFTYSPGLLERISTDGFPRAVSFGIIDGRNTKMESSGETAKSLEKALAKIEAEGSQITTSCGLEFLPRDYAVKKLKLTAEVARLING